MRSLSSKIYKKICQYITFAFNYYKAASIRKTVKLNIGGKNFETIPETLRKSEYFCNLLDEGWAGNNTLFVDRDGFLFRFILLYLRTNELDVDRKHLKNLKNEADFYLLPALSQLIESAMYQEPKNTKYKLLDQEEFTRLYNFGTHVIEYTRTHGEKYHNINFITSIQFVERVCICPRGKISHDNEPKYCGKDCNKAKGSNYVEYKLRNKNMYLVSVESNE